MIKSLIQPNILFYFKTDQTSPVKGLDPRTAFLQGHVSELRNFKVIGVVDRVILVIDVISETTYVIKVSTLYSNAGSTLVHCL